MDWDFSPPDKDIIAGSFSWDSIPPDDDLAETSPSSVTESAIRGAAQGASFGFADEIAGGLGAIKDKFSSDENLTDLYKKNRDESRSLYKIAEKSNPKTYLAGEIGGGIASSIVPLGAAKTVGGLALQGARLGTIGALGASEADTAAGLVEDAGLGMATGAGLGAAGGVVGSALKRASEPLGESLKDFAEKRAFKALGGAKKHTEKAASKGKINEIGRMLLDDEIVSPLASKEKMASRVGQSLDEVSGSYQKLLDAVASDDNLTDAQRYLIQKSKFVPKDAADVLKQQIRSEYSHIPEEILEPRLKQVDQWLSSDQPMDIKQAQKFKTQMQQWIKDPSYWKDPNASQETLMGVRKSIKEGIEKNADEFARATHGDAGQVKNLNQKMGSLLESEDILQDRISRDRTNRSLSLTDYLAGLGGAAAGDPTSAMAMIKGAGAALANKVGREYGNNLLATSADSVSKFLLRSPRMQNMSHRNPKAFAALVNNLSQRVGESGAGKMVSGNDDHKIERQAQDQFVQGN